MKRVFAFGLFAASIAVIGCGETTRSGNIMEGEGQSAIQSYEEMVAADEAMMNEDPGDAAEADDAGDAAPATE